MYVNVQFIGVDEERQKKLSAYLIANWSDVVVDTKEDNVAILIVRNAAAEGEELQNINIIPVLKEEIVIGDMSMDSIILLLNAKLGKLSHSDLAAARKKQRIPQREISRRDFLFGALRTVLEFSDLPVFVAERCEGRFGCNACIDVCPSDALKRDMGKIIVNDDACTRCGLCADACPTNALQLPTLLSDALVGLLVGIDNSESPRKTLVLTDALGALRQEPGMIIEYVKTIGHVNVKHLVLAAASSIGALIVHAAGDASVGKNRAQKAVASVSAILGRDAPALAFVEGTSDAALEEIYKIHESAFARKPLSVERGIRWIDYTNALASIAKKGASADTLKLTDLAVSDDCTLCGICVKVCPHSAIDIEGIELLFTSKNCTGCGFCRDSCQEKAITLSPLASVAGLEQRAVNADKFVHCARCGKPFMRAKFLERIHTKSDLEKELIRYCTECRQIVAKEKEAHSESASSPALD